MKVHTTFFGRVLINSDYKSVVTWREPRGLYNVQKNIRDEKLFKLKTDLCQSILSKQSQKHWNFNSTFQIYFFAAEQTVFSVSVSWLVK